jgi:hypothetical protein
LGPVKPPALEIPPTIKAPNVPIAEVPPNGNGSLPSDEMAPPNVSGKPPPEVEVLPSDANSVLNEQLNKQATQNVGKVSAPIDFNGHTLGGEVKANGNVVGGHSTASGDVRIIQGTESAPNAQGVYQARIEVPDPANPGQWLSKSNNGGVSTMFPNSWTADRIKVEVDAAYQNRVITGNKWTGVTPSGVKVEGYLAPNTTVYPIY